MPVPPCLSPFSLSVADYCADENESDESCRVSLGLPQLADFVCKPEGAAISGGSFFVPASLPRAFPSSSFSRFVS